MAMGVKTSEKDGVKAGLLRGLRAATKWKSFVILLPCVVWLVILYVVPHLVMVRYSLLSNMPHLGTPTITVSHYLEPFRTTLYAKVFIQSAKFAGITTISLLLLGYPVAYYLAKKTARESMVLILLIIPFWTSSVLRAFGWMILLNRTGLVNALLQWLGLTKEPLQLMYNWRAVIMGLIYGYIPFMILPLYSAIGRLKDDLLEASADLGANPLETFLRITLPLTLPGIVAGVSLVFVTSFTDTLNPMLLGGPYDSMIASTLFNIFTMGMNWPLGSALSILLFVILLLTLALTMGTAGRVQYEAQE